MTLFLSEKQIKGTARQELKGLLWAWFDMLTSEEEPLLTYNFFSSTSNLILKNSPLTQLIQKSVQEILLLEIIPEHCAMALSD
jgi:hypothetical protein